MKHSTITSLGLAVLAGASLVSPVRATTTIDTFGTGGNAFTMSFVDIGNPGNAPDTTGEPNPAGAVAYSYRMSTYEVSVDMIKKANAATAGVLGITQDTRGDNKPATSVSWNEAARFVNWLNVSSGSVAAYKFTTSGVNDNITPLISGESGYNAANPFRNSNAKYFLPSEDEWYKAAYYDPNKTGGAGYYDYATGSDTAPSPVASGTASGTAVYNQHVFASPADITSAGGLSPYGTMGQGGNAWEWMETNYSGINDASDSSRWLRGSCWNTFGDNFLASSAPRIDFDPSIENNSIGFRVASSFSAIPEPTSMLSTLALISSGLLLRRRTKALR